MPPRVPNLTSIATRHDLGRALTQIRVEAMLTVRDIELLTGIPVSTLGGYFAGRHLPPLKSNNLPLILRVCGVREPADINRWMSMLRRIHRGAHASIEAAEPADSGDPQDSATMISTRPPVGRLSKERGLHGRGELLGLLGRSLDRRASGKPAQAVHVIHGIGGVGKSTVALVLASRAVRLNVQTWWITADGDAGVSAGMRALAVELGAARELMRLGSIPDVVWRLLNLHPRPWMLVIDNADDPPHDLAAKGVPVTDGTGWVRPVEGRYGMVVVTTRDGSAMTWGDGHSWLRLHRIGGLDTPDGVAVLRELGGPSAGGAEEAAALSERLGGLPLALRSASAHLAEASRMPGALAGPVTFSDYVRALDDGLHEEVFADDQLTGGSARRLIGQTWELSLDLLSERGSTLARPLLRLLCCFRLAAIPYGLLLPIDELARSPLFPALTPGSLRTALRALVGVGLVDLVQETTADSELSHTLVLHPLVRDVNRRHPDVRDRTDDYVTLLTKILVGVAENLDPSDPTSWIRWRALADHCQSPLDLAAELPGSRPDQAVLRPAVLAARYLRAAGNLFLAEERYAATLETGRRFFGLDHPEVVAIEHDLNRVRHGLGQYTRTEEGLRRVLSVRERDLGPDHPDTLTTRHYLARALRDIGRVAESEHLLLATLRDRERVLGPGHPHTLTSRNNLADLWREQGRLEEARHGLEEVLSARRELFGDDYPATLITRHYLARVEQDAGDLLAAARTLSDLHRTCCRVLGREHPRRLNVLQSLAEVRRALGDRRAAQAMLREVFDTRVAVLGESHPATVRVRDQLSHQ
ncbi:tetratricopeptide repeat protein [Herbidospora sp. RD11066]